MVLRGHMMAMVMAMDGWIGWSVSLKGMLKERVCCVCVGAEGVKGKDESGRNAHKMQGLPGKVCVR